MKKLGVCSFCKDPIYDFQQVAHSGCVKLAVGIEDALQEYADSEISTEKLAERIGVNFYVLHNALTKKWP